MNRRLRGINSDDLVTVAAVLAAVFVGIMFPLVVVLASSPSCHVPDQIMAESTLTLTVSEEKVEPGELFEARLEVTPAEGAGIVGLQCDVKFNPASVRVLQVEEGGFLGQAGTGTFFYGGVIDNDAGIVTPIYGIPLGQVPELPQPGVFARLLCEAVGPATSSAFVLDNVLAGNAEGVAVPLVPSVPVQVVVAVFGDINDDGMVDQADLELIGDVFGWTGPAGAADADLNNDGAVNILDVILAGQQFTA